MKRMAGERLILALDVEPPEKALGLARRLAPYVGTFKIGPALVLAGGPAFLDTIKALGKALFLDLKLYDIPETVARTTRQAAASGADFLTIHVAGGARMIGAAREAAGDRVKLLGVTVLTSFNQDELEREWRMEEPIADRVVFWAKLATESGAHGVVCSPLELPWIREMLGPKILTVVPGIRPGGGAGDDQRRTLPAKDAIRLGADFLVVGRPIVAADSPEAAAEAFGREIAEGGG
ncbi:MAG: orotidine-5'-phosphate decarboxylase [Candidatus Coatesbacteria bacterium]